MTPINERYLLCSKHCATHFMNIASSILSPKMGVINPILQNRNAGFLS